MAFQTGSNVLVAIKRETTTGVAPATVTGASQMRVIASPGMTLRRAGILSQERRTDMVRPLGRLGAKKVDGTYNAEITVGGATDMLLESIMRATWATATAVTFPTMTTVALGSNTVTAAAGDWLAGQGVRVGDIFTISGTTIPANHAVNARVIAVTTLTITTVTGAFTTLAATATGTLIVAKKLKNGTTPVRYSHSVEEYNQDIDFSELFLGCRLVGLKLSFKPGAMAQVSYMFAGLDRTALVTGTSPFYTSPTLTTGLALVADDSAIRANGVGVTTFTGFDLDFTIANTAEPVIGSFVSPDVFDNDLSVSGTITGLRQDFANLTLFDAETEFEVSILLQEPAAAAANTPKAFINLFLPRVKIAGIDSPFGGDGAQIETLALMVGPKVAATGYDGTVATFCSSAP